MQRLFDQYLHSLQLVLSDSSTSTTTATAATTATSSTARTDSSKYTGRVKWFNNKFGYGFITVVSTDADASAAIGSDVFAHHSEVSVGEDQYRYLVQGEYVEFSVVKTTSGQLICETRHTAREQYNKTTATGGSNTTSSTSASTSTLPRPGNSSSSTTQSFSGPSSGEHRFSGVRPATRGGRGGFSGGTSGRGGRGGSGGSSGGFHI